MWNQKKKLSSQIQRTDWRLPNVEKLERGRVGQGGVGEVGEKDEEDKRYKLSVIQ